MDSGNRSDVVIVGAGPAGLTAAWELAQRDQRTIVLERDDQVGGLSRTVVYRDYRFDIGGHRFYTKVPEVEALWHEMLGDDLLERPRLSRIHYRGTFFDYPLKPLNALRGLGPLEASRVGLSYLRAQLGRHGEDRTFEQWVSNRFGRRLFQIFFKTYTEKVWGMPCSEISADWAMQRIKNLDLGKAILNSLLRRKGSNGEVITTLIDRFHYPRLGPGMMWERMAERVVERGAEVRLGADVVGLAHREGSVRTVEVRGPDGRTEIVEGEQFISTMPLRTLIRSLDPPPPVEVVRAADSLRYRDFLTVVLIVDRAELFPDNWIYIHSPEVRVGRVQNFKNWSPEMVPDPSRSSLGLEYFVSENDDLWSASDEDLVALGTREMEALGLIEASEVVDGTVVRMPKAYPTYPNGYERTLAVLRGYLEGFANLQVVGRNGQHRYNNQDHSMLAGLYAARNLNGARLDVWAVNVEPTYQEEIRDARLTPSRVAAQSLEELVRRAFARYDPLALGSAVGVVGGLGVFLATAVLLLRGGDPVGPNLSLLGNYLLGYEVTWGGALLGLVEAALGGFVIGCGMAGSINAVIAQWERAIRRRLELRDTLDPLELPGE